MSKNKYIYKTLLPKKENYFYPLSDDNLSKQDLNAGIEILRSGRITVDVIFHELMSINNFKNRKELAMHCENQILSGLNQTLKNYLK